MRKHPRLTALAFGSLALAACADGPTQPEPAFPPGPEAPALAVSNTWTTRQQIWPPRYFAVAGKINGVIYVVGGYASLEGVTRRVSGYNVASNTWFSLESLPTPRWKLSGASVINGKLYVAGGNSEFSGRVSRDLLVYTPKTNKWVVKRRLPITPACEGGAQGVIGGKLYIYVPCGGPVYPRLFRYDPATDRYTWLPGPPIQHVYGVAGVIDGKFYVGGGLSSGLPTRELHVFDPATGAWTSRTALPADRFNAASAVLDGKLFAIGGQLPGISRGDSTLSWYDPATNAWTSGASMPTPRFGAAAATAGGRVYVIGGADPTGLRAKVEAYMP